MLGQFPQLIGFFRHRFRRETGSDDYKFVSAHSSHVIVLSAALFQSHREEAKDAVAFQMAKAVVYLFETVHVADHDCEGRCVTLAAG